MTKFTSLVVTSAVVLSCLLPVTTFGMFVSSKARSIQDFVAGEHALSSTRDSGYGRSLVTGSEETFIGGFFRLECMSFANAGERCYDTTWLLNGVNVLADGLTLPTIASSINVENDDRQKSVLTVYGPTEKAQGLYTCYQACLSEDDEWLLSEGHRYVSVFSPGTYNQGLAFRMGAKLEAGYGSLAVPVGGELQFKCYGTNPIYWTRAKRFIHFQHESRLRTDHLWGGLTVPDVTLEDSNVYGCLAQNDYGSEKASFHAAVLSSDASHNVPLHVFGPLVVRKHQSAEFHCMSEQFNRTRMSISWKVPAGFTAVGGEAWNSITVRNDATHTDSRHQIWCTVTLPSSSDLPVSTAFTTIQSASMPLRRPRKIAIKDKKLLVRVSPPRGGFTEEERDSVLGVRLTLSTKSWQWTRQFIFSSDGVFQRKFPLMDIVYDRDDLLRQMIGKTITLTASFLDKYSEYSQGEEATKTLKLDNVPPLVRFTAVSAVPGQPGTIRVQWDSPEAAVNVLRNLRLRVAWRDVMNASHMAAWSPSRQIANIDVSSTRSVVFSGLPLSGVFQFQLWLTDASEPARQFPVRISRLVSFPDFQTFFSASTSEFALGVTVQGSLRCAHQYGLSQALSLLEKQVVSQVSTLCTDCHAAAGVDSRTQFAVNNSTCNHTRGAFSYSLTTSVTVKVYEERSLCGLLTDLETSLQRDSRNAQSSTPTLGSSTLTQLCIEKNGTSVCLSSGQHSSQPWHGGWRHKVSGEPYTFGC